MKKTDILRGVDQPVLLALSGFDIVDGLGNRRSHPSIGGAVAFTRVQDEVKLQYGPSVFRTGIGGKSDVRFHLAPSTEHTRRPPVVGSGRKITSRLVHGVVDTNAWAHKSVYIHLPIDV